MACRMNWQDLVASETLTAQLTESALQGFCRRFPRMVDTLIKVAYISPPAKDPETPQGYFQFYCWMQYLQCPYTFAALFRLWTIGYYYEAIILERHLVETLLQMKYFEGQKDLLEDHVLGRKRKRFTEMFGAVASGARRTYRILSNVAHGGLTKDIFRVERSSPTEGRVVMGNQYSEVWASYVMNVACALLYGFLTYYPRCFPETSDLIEKDPEVGAPYRDAIAWLEKAFEGHVEIKTGAEEWYDEIGPLIGYERKQASRLGN